MKRCFLLALVCLLLLAQPTLAESYMDLLPKPSEVVMYETCFDMGELDSTVHQGTDLISGITQVSSLAEAYMLITSNRADVFTMFYETVRYIASLNPALIAVPGFMDVNVHMIASMDHSELVVGINEALQAMREEGLMDTLWQEHVEDVIAGAEPVAIAMPKIAGAPTYRFGVSGDCPPLDYTSADGIPAGYNTAILAEISQRVGANFELISMESGARYIALMSGAIDAFFWHESLVLSENNLSKDQIAAIKTVVESQVNFIMSDPYCTLNLGFLLKGKEGTATP